MGVSTEESDPCEPERDRERDGCEDRGGLRGLEEAALEADGGGAESLEDARWDPGGGRRCCHRKFRDLGLS